MPKLTLAAIIPCLNEEATIASVVEGLRARGVQRVIVADNGSHDASAANALQAGAEVVHEPRRGYGSACLRAMRVLEASAPDAVLFCDGDGADDLNDVSLLEHVLVHQGADIVVGSRSRGPREPGALLPQARVGNAIATLWIRALTGVAFTDLGPLRLVRWPALIALQMDDPDYGWTVQMQLRAARRGLRCAEIPVRYKRRRGGTSKVSANLRGSVLAGVTILRVLGRETVAGWRRT